MHILVVSVTGTVPCAEGKATYKYIDFTFSSLTPGGREVERNGCIKVLPPSFPTLSRIILRL